MRIALVIVILLFAGCASLEARPKDAKGDPVCRAGEAPAAGTIPEAQAVNETRALWAHQSDGAPMNATAMARHVVLTGDALLFESTGVGCGALIGGAGMAAPKDGKAHDAWDVQLRAVPDPTVPTASSMDVWTAFVDTTTGDIVATQHVM
jgi:hypothetical protein